MGWLWSSSNKDKPSTPSEEAPPTSTPTQQPPTSTSTSSTTDPEIQKFIDLFESEKNAKPETPSQKDQQSSNQHEQRPPPPPTYPPRDALSEALLPTDMSCRQAFDQAWACNSMGGQWNAVYRYGEMRSCSEHWDDFWFCMRTKGYSPEMREKAIREHYRAKEFVKYGPGKPSSEDVWESREERVPEGSTFNQPIE
ncbi:hypothetical protein NW754_016417 [Fusarium falciforme]|nr:hypothetical protein NW754_016417 [Fusarium falciforme]